MVMGNLDNQPLQQRLQAMLVSINAVSYTHLRAHET